MTGLRNAHRGVGEARAEELLRAISLAYEQLQTARRTERRRGDYTDRRLTTAVEAARDAGVEWGRIADALETRRGNAYQRYRRRPRPSAAAAGG